MPMKQSSLTTTNLFHLLSNVLNNTNYLFWVYDEMDRLVFANTCFFSTTKITESSIGKTLAELTTDPSLIELVKTRLEVTRKGNGTKHFNDIVNENSNIQYYDSNWYNVNNACGNFVAGYAINVTNKRKQGMEVQKLSSRLSYITLNSDEAVWEWELKKNHFHFTDKITALSGYYSEMKQKGIDFWLQTVVHPDDKETIIAKLKKYLDDCITYFRLEYHIITKTGETKKVCDTVRLIYKERKPVRVFGCLKDITEKEALQKEVAANEIEKEKAVNAAYIQAQEEERDWLSKELHDNVNQLILSAKMYIGIAKSQPEVADEMLGKAVEYQLLALEESRKLSKNMSSNIVEFAGFNTAINIICTNLEFTGIAVHKNIDEELAKKFDSTQSLMLLRIIQEQSSNIIKYAKAKNVRIELTENIGIIRFQLSDDGVGFEVNKISGGIGLSNIKSRATALGSQLKIETAPDKGCKISLSFKIDSTQKMNIKCFAA
jgi:PAS domain S-box-containing protein